MNESKISVRYAKALFLAADEAGTLKDVMDDMSFIMKTYKEGRFREMLESPVVRPSDKKLVVIEIFSNRITALTSDFLDLLIS